MNEKRIQEVIEIEKQAQQLLAKASRAAEDLPAKAELEAREIIEQARASAKQEAKELLERSAAEDEAAEIISRSQAKMGDDDRLAEKNMEKAVTYVLQQVIGGS
jgi:vacuolar-type H+-ATPase subunit H